MFISYFCFLRYKLVEWPSNVISYKYLYIVEYQYVGHSIPYMTRQISTWPHKGQMIFFFHKKWNMGGGGGAKIINFRLQRIRTRYILHFVQHSPVWLHYLYMFIPNILQHGSKIKLARNNLNLFLGQHHNVSINTFSN